MIAEGSQIATGKVELEVKLNLSQHFYLHFGDLKLQGFIYFLGASSRLFRAFPVGEEELGHMIHGKVFVVDLAGEVHTGSRDEEAVNLSERVPPQVEVEDSQGGLHDVWANARRLTEASDELNGFMDEPCLEVS